MKKLLLLGLLALSAFGLELTNATLLTGVQQSLSLNSDPRPVIITTDKYSYLGEAKTNIGSDRFSIRLISKCEGNKCFETKGYVVENGILGVQGTKVINEGDIKTTSSALIGILTELVKSNDPEVRKLYLYYQALYFDAISGSLLVEGNKPVQIFETR